MKKRITAIIFILLFVSAVVWLIIEGSKPEVLSIGSNLPNISFLSQNGKTTISKTNGKILIVFFSKECPHCKYELSVLDKNLEKLNKVKIFLLTAEKDFLGSGDIKVYQNLLKSKTVTFGIVDKKEYKTKLGTMVTPALYFFSNNMLTAKLKGETKFERILKELNK